MPAPTGRIGASGVSCGGALRGWSLLLGGLRRFAFAWGWFLAQGFALLPGEGASLHPHPLKSVPAPTGRIGASGVSCGGALRGWSLLLGGLRRFAFAWSWFLAQGFALLPGEGASLRPCPLSTVPPSDWSQRCFFEPSQLHVSAGRCGMLIGCADLPLRLQLVPRGFALLPGGGASLRPCPLNTVPLRLG
ncbi:hypothetical protein GCM10010532_108900 [Dactylosporangium siamense]